MALDPFARRIVALREERGWSQNHLAERAGIRAADLSRILTGMRGVLPYHVVRLAVALDTTPAALLKGAKLDVDLDADVPSEQLTQSEAGCAAAEQELAALQVLVGEVSAELSKLGGQVADTGAKKPAAMLEQAAARLASLSGGKRGARKAAPARGAKSARGKK
jgi:transcriptional regulator with XRE-family HTH domain